MFPIDRNDETGNSQGDGLSEGVREDPHLFQRQLLAMNVISPSARALLLTASVGCAMTVLNSNLIGIALPLIARDFGASFAETAWVVSAFLLSFSALLLPAGSIADRYGRRRVFLAGTVAFGLGALACGLAPSPAALYFARGVQGAAAAFLLAPALAIIGHAFHGGAARDRAWAIWGAMMGLTMLLAPLLGGMLVARFGWRAAFLVNLPICAALCAATLAFIDESREERPRRLDPAGILLFATLMFGLTWCLISGQGHGWTSGPAMTGLGVGLAALTAFILVERRREEPMLDLGLFRDPRLVGGVWAMLAYAACAQVMASLLPLLLQNGVGYAPVAAGIAMLPFGIAMFVFPHVGRALGRRLQPPEILLLGLLVVAVGDALAGWGAQSGALAAMLGGMAAIGAGGGLLNGETQKAILGVMPRGLAGMGAGVSTTARFSGVLLGFAALSGIMALSAQRRLGEVPEAFAQAVVAGDLETARASLPGAAPSDALATAQAAYMGGFSTALFTAAVVAAVSAGIVWRLTRARPARRAYSP